MPDLLAASMLTLRNVVDRYASLAPKFGAALALSAFGLSAEETQSIFTQFDEDYHISRFLHFSRSEGQNYVISGEAVTHVSFDEAIYSIL